MQNQRGNRIGVAGITKAHQGIHRLSSLANLASPLKKNESGPTLICLSDPIADRICAKCRKGSIYSMLDEGLLERKDRVGPFAPTDTKDGKETFAVDVIELLRIIRVDMGDVVPLNSKNE